MRSPIPLVLSFLIFVSSAVAVFKDDAYQTDWHIPLIGPSLPESTFFHRPSPDSKATLIYTLTSRSILAAINPKDGTIVWRQALADGAGKLGMARGGEGLIVAGAGQRVEAFDAANGKLAWENEFAHAVEDVAVVMPQNEAVVLFADGTVRLLHGVTGDVIWERAGTDGKEKASSLALAGNSVMLVSLQPSKKTHLTTISLATGGTQGSVMSISSGADSTSEIYGSSALLSWTENSLRTVKLLPLNSKASPTSISVPSSVVDVKIHAEGSAAVVHYQSTDKSWADVYTVNLDKGTLTRAYSLDSRPGSKSAIAISGSSDVTYITWIQSTGETLLYRSDSPEILASYPISSNPLDADIPHSISEVVPRVDGKSYAVRTFLTSSVPGFSGDTHLIRNGEVAWTRTESLASVADSTWVELLDPSTEEVAGELDVETHTNIAAAYIHRVNRHLHELIAYGPDWLRAIPGRVLGSLSATESEDKSGKWRDFFGFRKLIVVVTEEGGVATLDAGHGGVVVWKSNILPTQGEWKGISGIYEVGKGIVGIVLTSGAFVQYDAFEGAILSRETLEGTVRNTALVEDESGKLIIVAIFDDEKVVTLPSGSDIGSKAVHLVTRDCSGTAKGIRFSNSQDPTITWTFRAPALESITSLTTRPAHDPVASIGKVLGDRSVMYKYLNPNLLAITTADETQSTVSIHILDSVSGAILHSSTHLGVDTTKPVSAALSQNWLVYSYFGDDDVVSESVAKGYHLVVSELYESEFKNDRGSLGPATNFSSFDAVKENPHVLSQAYIVTSALSALTTTSTKQGISSKEILTILPSSSIATISKRVLDPRRPFGRDPTPAEMEEGLFRYTPSIEIDPRSIITHERKMMGLKKVVTSPAELESTSLVFAYGGDLFGTRVAPSMTFDILGKGFNKIQLVITVVALMAGTSFVAPMVRRKQINARWTTL